MVNVSKKFLNEKVYRDILTQLSVIIARAHTRKESSALLYDFLSPKERIQLAKRTAIIALLRKGVYPKAIMRVLQVSSATVAYYQEALERGEYGVVIRALKKKEYDESISGLLEKILSAGLPPQGKGRWKKLFYE